ncbi:hypothetical protein Q4595_29235, partial [Wenyingzhuangia sp. 1_MG-2023]|nr:hypothetical protein [Wenyingzhuangia sp. 1_MG-2023]
LKSVEFNFGNSELSAFCRKAGHYHYIRGQDLVGGICLKALFLKYNTKNYDREVRINSNLK